MDIAWTRNQNNLESKFFSDSLFLFFSIIEASLVIVPKTILAQIVNYFAMRQHAQPVEIIKATGKLPIVTTIFCSSHFFFSYK